MATISDPGQVEDPAELSEVWRRCAPDVVAALVRRYGDFGLAEDATQEALLAAAEQWPREGLPRDPRAWLIRVASRRLVDQIRSDRARTDRELRDAHRDLALAPSDHDDSLALLVLCCHPALSPPSQVALTLRAVAGLSTGQIARAFLVPEPTMGTRISRAKARLREVGARFTVPAAAELPSRVAAVNQVLYLVFTEGHTATTGAGLQDPALSAEAIRLARRLHACLPDDGEVAGLLALLLLTDARRAARIEDGRLAPLSEQDRSRWDAAAIAEGIGLVEAALPRGSVGPFQLQAAIAAVHAEAATAADTDWAQIETLYAMLSDLAPSPVVTLNRAVAVAMVHGPQAGLALIAPLADDPQLSRRHRLPAVRGHLLELTGDLAGARAAYADAARLATSIPEQHYLNAKARGL